MKKVLLSAVALMAFGFASNAQEVKFGAKAGLNLSSITNLDGGKTRTSFHVGALAEIKVADKFAVQPEVLYSSQGAKGEGDVSLKMDYINVPIMAKYYVADGFSIEAGPQVGFLMSAKLESVDVKDTFNTVDFGFNAGIGYELKEGIFFQGRYNLGLTNLAKESGDQSRKNSVFQVSVGYKFL
ncbi:MULTISPECIES: porin family protein [Flavobacterium]|uniref:porin family protein n=1 Tax=Flavobacterium TaxID=237 RepID=UPI00096635CC|nr:MULTISPECIES: porin family protein [Flavobacterium]MBN9283154.1 PorT family protein [Flavobacterium sp.]OJV67780.1 MAG: hypothetical protein BGO42_17305 [Flavobacterium sp. 40-81]